MRRGGLAGLAVMSLGVGSAFAATTTLQISITNTSGDSGLSLTPLYLGFHDGSFDAFDVGGTASAGLELLAEEGMFGTLAAEREAATTDMMGVVTSQGAVAAAPGSPFGFGGPPVIEPGETATVTVDIDSATQGFLSYFSMIIPSNDLFIGTDNAIQLFDGMGNFVGAQTIDITEADVYDAGTEVNTNTGAAFNTAGGTDIDENGVITLAGASALNVLTGQTGANGVTIGGSPVNLLASITISEVPAVPLPAGAPLILTGLGLFGYMRAKKKKS